MSGRHYRTAVYLSTVIEPRAERLRLNEPSLRQTAFALADRELGISRQGVVPVEGALSARFEVKRWALDLVQCSNELRWFRTGIAAGYFDGSPDSIYGAAAHLIDVETADFASRLDESVPSPQLPDFDEFHRSLAAADDAMTAGFYKCVEMLLFSTFDEWAAAMNHLSVLTAQMSDNPALSIDAASVDQLSWALAGADDLIAWVDEETAIPYIALEAIRAKDQVDPGDWGFENSRRIEQLKDRRNGIAAAAFYLTDDQGAAASTRIANLWRSLDARTTTDSVAPGESDWVFDVSGPPTTAPIATPRYEIRKDNPPQQGTAGS